jgi:adenosine deaminase
MLRAIPKVELHVHLEGSVHEELSLELARKNNVDIGAATATEVRKLYEFTDFEHFLQLYGKLAMLFAEPADFATAVRSYGARVAADNVIYAEMTLSLGTHCQCRTMDPEAVLREMWDAAQQVEAEHGVVIRFVLDHVRSYPAEWCAQLVDWCVQFRALGVIALGLAGPEQGWPASTYGDAIVRARELGVPFVPHAGEADGPDAIRDALNFTPRRIGHGTSVRADPSLAAELLAADVLVEACPTSNVVLGNLPSYDLHPARMLHDAGVPICFNTDDPPMVATTMLHEHVIAHEQLGFTVDELVQINRRALDYALAAPAICNQLKQRF